jgi:hypothetical protein
MRGLDLEPFEEISFLSGAGFGTPVRARVAAAP